jgi:hypothetical protein
MEYEEHTRNNNGTHHAVVMRSATTQPVLCYSQQVGLKKVKPAESEEQEHDNTHHTNSDGAIIITYIISSPHSAQFFLSTTALRAGM